MQQLVNANSMRPDVAIYFVNTRQKEANKIDVVNKFFKERPYRFDVLMDTDDKVAKAYNVEGIPAKFVIDKKGRIRFFSLGFYGQDQKSIDELQAMIDMAGEM